MFPATQALANSLVVNNIPKMVGEGGKSAFFRPLLDFVMTNNEHDITKDDYEFILDSYERLYLSWVFLTNMGLSSCPFKFKMRPSNGKEITLLHRYSGSKVASGKHQNGKIQVVRLVLLVDR